MVVADGDEGRDSAAVDTGFEVDGEDPFTLATDWVFAGGRAQSGVEPEVGLEVGLNDPEEPVLGESRRLDPLLDAADEAGLGDEFASEGEVEFDDDGPPKVVEDVGDFGKVDGVESEAVGKGFAAEGVCVNDGTSAPESGLVIGVESGMERGLAGTVRAEAIESVMLGVVEVLVSKPPKFGAGRSRMVNRGSGSPTFVESCGRPVIVRSTEPTIV